ncbi:MAG: HAD family phosphatase [Clostridia bacterium]|nr:HAD family phosphatase [Clostridia bacterium]
MKKLSGILFDFNGTLLHDSKLHMECFRRVFPLFGAPEPNDEYIVKNIFGRSTENIYLANINPNPEREELDSYVKVKNGLYYDMCLALGDDFKLCAGAYEMLDYLKNEKIPYCLATGSNREEVEFYMEHLGLGRWFSYDNIVYTDGTFTCKPAPDCYILAAQRIGLDPSECVVFEDGKAGIKAANAAGVGTVVAVYEQGLPSPASSELDVYTSCNDFSDWRSLLSDLGFIS